MKKLTLILAMLLVVTMVFAGCGNGAPDTTADPTPEPTAAPVEKNITVNVVNGEDTETFKFVTTKELLVEALVEQKLVSGIDHPANGLFITTVNEVTADDMTERWKISHNGEELLPNPNFTSIADGDTIELSLMKDA